ncbi:hypothetical protein CCR75_001618 [Bremia lactucae]|uniref:Uncharacterized protein n=1 Tax=Bremia lactucae TaxID=4779 RepID=A0A976FP23_BRELC|nr:hypothetical protein CCR75_001618 [Bremia lactucae]
MATDTYYRQVLTQLQSEFSRAVAALEKQVATLTRHNALLTHELAQTKAHQTQWTHEATATVTQLETQAASAKSNQQAAAAREQALTLEIAALKTLLQQEQDYYTRSLDANQHERDRITQLLAQAHAKTSHQTEQNQSLQRQIQALERRVETAVATSQSFEQRLVTVVHEKHEHHDAILAQVAHYKKKLHEKRAQNKYLTDALVRLQSLERGIDPKPLKESSQEQRTYTMDTSVPLRVKKRDLTLPNEIKSTESGALRRKKNKRLEISRSGTSPTSSSPDISPRSARVAPYKRHLSTRLDPPVSSPRSFQRLQHVTTRSHGSSSQNNSRNDSIDGMPRLQPGEGRLPTPTGRLQRELRGLRQKLDTCMAETTARW